jgi:hypothetical protein
MKKIIAIVLYINIYYTSSVFAQSCEKTASITVTIRNYNLSILTKQTDYCEGDELNLESSFGLAKKWLTPTKTITAEKLQIAKLTLADAGIYICSAEDSLACISSDTIQIRVFPKTNVVSTSNSPVCVGKNIQLNTQATGGTYHWTGPNGFISTTKDPIITANDTTAAGWYYLQYTNEYGCLSQDSSYVAVKVCTDQNTLLFNSNIEVFPSPAKEFIQIVIHDQVLPEKISLMNAIGEELFTSNWNVEKSMKITVQDWPTGVYYLKFDYKEFGHHFKKINIVR